MTRLAADRRRTAARRAFVERDDRRCRAAVRNIETKATPTRRFRGVAGARLAAGAIDPKAEIFGEAPTAADAIARNEHRAAAYVDIARALTID